MKRHVGFLFLVMMLLMMIPAWPGKKPFVIVGSLSEELNDVGCAFTPRNAGPEARQIFKSGLDGSWMNLDGRDVQLTPVEEAYPRAVYQAGDIRVFLRYGYGREGEGGVSYPRAEFRLMRGKERMKIKAEGGCGC